MPGGRDGRQQRAVQVWPSHWFHLWRLSSERDSIISRAAAAILTSKLCLCRSGVAGGSNAVHQPLPQWLGRCCGGRQAGAGRGAPPRQEAAFGVRDPVRRHAAARPSLALPVAPAAGMWLHKPGVCPADMSPVLMHCGFRWPLRPPEDCLVRDWSEAELSGNMRGRLLLVTHTPGTAVISSATPAAGCWRADRRPGALRAVRRLRCVRPRPHRPPALPQPGAAPQRRRCR